GNHPPTGAQLHQRYVDTLRRYYGTNPGAVAVADLDGVEWMTLSNEYYGHVFPEWSFAIAGAAAIAERVRAGDARVIDALTAPIHEPHSFTSYDLMRDVGADPASPSAYAPLMRRMTRDLDALDIELARPKGSRAPRQDAR